ncbi:MAG TPA: alkaline phosphatase family protein [Terriglobales bacterium]|nr:alkaline phosphatase family protein [Terriglobales bacterium]
MASPLFASAYNARPKLIVVIIIDQFRGDYLERGRERFGENGFRLLMDRGAYFVNCHYDYANTRTAPGHATLFTGAYTDGHGILSNEWWDPAKKKMVTSVEDDSNRLVGIADPKSPGASPHNLLADTLGDELKLATQGKSHVYAVSLKDRAAILPGGFSADAAYWIDHKTGAWITSTYYRSELPAWVREFNSSGRADKYWKLDWKGPGGDVLRSTKRPAGGGDFYDIIGPTPFANDYELEFARELITQEKLGDGPATDLLVISLSANDILGHRVGPDSIETQAMVVALDHELAEFFGFLGRQIGLANIWIALSADHGVSARPDYAKSLRIPAANLDNNALRTQLNDALAAKFGRADYVEAVDWPIVFLSADAFAHTKLHEGDAERAAGEALKETGLRSYFTRAQLANFEAPPDSWGGKYLHSYSPYGGWYLLGVPAPYFVGSKTGTDHASPYNYDTHVPLLFFGLAFQPGIYRGHVEPVDMVVTLASLLGINAPSHATGRVLTEALAVRSASPSSISSTETVTK